MSSHSNRNSIVQYSMVVLFLAVLWNIAYQTPRADFEFFIGQYFIAFAAFYILWINRAGFSFRRFLMLAVLARLLLLLAVPQLSNDFYRFIWDGEIMTMGINPYAHTPGFLMSHGKFMADPYLSELFVGMGELSQQHYSCYPVLNQLLFIVPASVSNSISANVVVLKLIVILADVIAIIYGKKILVKLGRDPHLIWLYALNPFIIFEFSGNVHFEGVMIMFLMMSMYFLLKNNWLISALLMGMAIQIKLIPLILIPFVFKKLKWFRSVGYLAMTAFTVILVGMVLLNESYMLNMWTSIREYFVAFEFNAGIYYLVREYDFAQLGWNNIAENGPLMSKLAMGGILLLALFRSYREDRDIFTGMMFAFVIYYSFSTTVHPWYISLVLIFSIFSRYKFGLIWSMVVMLSYHAYAHGSFEENPVFLWFEYIAVFGVMIYEIIRHTKKDAFGLQLKSFFSKVENEQDEE